MELLHFILVLLTEICELILGLLFTNDRLSLRVTEALHYTLMIFFLLCLLLLLLLQLQLCKL